jgi:hypothetical protein
MIILINVFNWVKKNFFNVVILILVSVILLQKCNSDTPKPIQPKIVKDTVWVVTKNTVTTKPVLVKTIPGKANPKYIPDPNYSKLLIQYQALVKAHIAKNIQRDSIKIDSIGYVHIEDTVSENVITGRKTSYLLKYPIITKTITLPPLRTNQLYYGGGLQGGQKQLINQFNVGLILKTKSDQIYNIYTGLDTDGQVQVGLQAYWKIKLHK